MPISLTRIIHDPIREKAFLDAEKRGKTRKQPGGIRVPKAQFLNG